MVLRLSANVLAFAYAAAQLPSDTKEEIRKECFQDKGFFLPSSDVTSPSAELLEVEADEVAVVVDKLELDAALMVLMLSPATAKVVETLIAVS